VTSRTLRGALVLALAALSLGCSPRSLVPAATPTPRAEATGPLAAATPAPPPAPGAGFDSQRVAAILGPAVATVIVTSGRSTSEGSAFSVASQGGTTYMVTNNHVVAGGGRVQVVFLDGRHFAVSVKGTDPIGDLAVLSVPDGSLPLATFADSTKLKVGQPVVAIGSPLGQQGSVTRGIISALHRNITAGGSVTGPSESLPDVLQTDAAINPGNSGGPLADADGHVVGVNTAADRGAANVGFAIPSLLVKRLTDDLIAGRKPGHPFLGVGLEEEVDALAKGDPIPGYGTYVASVVSGSAADQAGLRRGDVIQKVDGIALVNGETLGGILQLHEPGEHVKLTILRNGAGQDVDAVLGDRPSGA